MKLKNTYLLGKILGLGIIWIPLIFEFIIYTLGKLYGTTSAEIFKLNISLYFEIITLLVTSIGILIVFLIRRREHKNPTGILKSHKRDIKNSRNNVSLANGLIIFGMIALFISLIITVTIMNELSAGMTGAHWAELIIYGFFYSFIGGIFIISFIPIVIGIIIKLVKYLRKN